MKKFLAIFLLLFGIVGCANQTVDENKKDETKEKVEQQT